MPQQLQNRVSVRMLEGDARRRAANHGDPWLAPFHTPKTFDSIHQKKAAFRLPAARRAYGGSGWLGVLFTFTLGLACRRIAESETPPTGVSERGPGRGANLSELEKIRFTPIVLATGKLKPRQSAQLSMPVPGTLARIFVRRGDEVKSGSVLAALDASGARASLAQTDAGVLAAQAQLTLADDTLRRLAVLRQRESVSDSQYVQAKGQRDLAAAQLKVALAQGEQVRVVLKNHTLVAPFSGIVIRAPEGTGMPVGPEAQLFALEDVSELVLETSVTQEEAAELPSQGRVSVEVPATGARVENASIRLVVPSVDPMTNRVPVEIAVPNPNRALLPHALARAHVPTALSRDAFRVPQAALTQRDGAFCLWMVGNDGKALAARVRVLEQPEHGPAVVDPGQAGFPSGARVIDSPPLGITVGAELAPGTPKGQ